MLPKRHLLKQCTKHFITLWDICPVIGQVTIPMSSRSSGNSTKCEAMLVCLIRMLVSKAKTKTADPANDHPSAMATQVLLSKLAPLFSTPDTPGTSLGRPWLSFRPRHAPSVTMTNLKIFWVCPMRGSCKLSGHVNCQPSC